MYLSKKEIKKIILNQKTSIKNAIQNMNKSGLKIVLAVDEKKSLSGIIVDGDIRRGLIKNLNLNSPIKNIVSQGGTAANRMEVDDKPNELTDTHKEFIKAIKDVSGDSWEVGSIERQSFYEEAKKSYAIVTTTDARPFGCFIITKGVIKPDGSVWVLDK